MTISLLDLTSTDSISHHILSLILLQAHISNAYYLSYNGIWWQDAEAFCVDHCNSHLASIHNDKQYTEIKTLITTDSLLSITYSTGDGYWIGLNNSTLTNTYVWTDGTPFDFGSDISGGAYPWLPNEPSISHPYTQLQVDTVNTTNNLKWQTNSFTENALPICNDCDWTQLSKYILLRWGQEDWYDSEIACNTNFGTNLASIHTNADEQEAQYVHIPWNAFVYTFEFLVTLFLHHHHTDYYVDLQGVTHITVGLVYMTQTLRVVLNGQMGQIWTLAGPRKLIHGLIINQMIGQERIVSHCQPQNHFSGMIKDAVLQINSYAISPMYPI